MRHLGISVEDALWISEQAEIHGARRLTPQPMARSVRARLQLWLCKLRYSQPPCEPRSVSSSFSVVLSRTLIGEPPRVMPSPLSPARLAKVQRDVDELFGGPSIAWSLDIRQQAGFSPALVLYITLPRGEPELRLLGPFRKVTDDCSEDVSPTRSEFWLLVPGPRSPHPVSALQTYAARSTAGDTLYRLYFQLPPDGLWRIEAPPLESTAWWFDSQTVSGHSERGQAFINSP